jgi:tetratricopeptide (TPR) repeat protein
MACNRNKGGDMKKRILLLMCILALPFSAWAAPVEFIKEYTYDAGETDSLLTCRTVSLMQVKRMLLESLGTYLESNTEIVNFQLKKDQITILTGGIVKTDIVDERWNGQTYWLKARMKSDPDDVVAAINKLKKNNQIETTVTRLTKEYDAAFEKIEELKEALAESQRNVVRLNEDYKNAQKFLLATKSLEKGIQLRKDKRMKEALESFNTGIESNPGYALYLERAKTYMKMTRYDRAIDDLDKAIQLKPDFAKAYFHKGIALHKKGHKRQGITWIKKAAKMGNKTARLWLKSRNML